MRFMASSLEKLACNLITPDLSNFRQTAKVFSNKDMKLVTRKGIYPHECTDSWEKLNETEIPQKHEFFSKLTENNISDEDYSHVIEVWSHFDCKTLGMHIIIYFIIKKKKYIFIHF